MAFNVGLLNLITLNHYLAEPSGQTGRKGLDMKYHCHKCGKDNIVVNQCGCDPNKLPTRIVITREDWVEIYYALVDKQSRVDDGEYEDEVAEDNPKPQAEWSKHLGDIIDKIGPDGENMAPDKNKGEILINTFTNQGF